jgi:Prophage CP4-57 regulatory protein (AlpA)
MSDSPAKLMLDEYKQLMKLYQLQSRLMRADERDAYVPETGERILRLREVVHRCGISKRTIYRLEAAAGSPLDAS